MNRYFIIFAVLLMIIAAAGIVLLSRSNAPAPPGQVGTFPTASSTASTASTAPTVSTQSQEVAATVRSLIHPGEQTVLYGNVAVGNYAIQLWGNPSSGGEALLKYDSAKTRWVLLSWGGGAWSVNGLIEEGVPQDTAAILLANLPH